MNHRRIAAAALSGALAVLLGGCGTVGSRAVPAYENSFLRPPLKVPPGLALPVMQDNTPSGSTLAGISAGISAEQPVLPQFPGIHLVRSGCQRWLVMQAKPQKVWDLALAFMKKQGLSAVDESRREGIIDSTWHAVEPYAAPANATTPRVLGARAAYRFRIERGMQPGNTELYISRRGVYEVATRDGNVWESAPPDPEAEARMLSAFMVYAGAAAPATAATPPTASLQVDAQGNTVLTFQDSLDNGWRRLGLALERTGWLIRDRNRSQWTYRVQRARPGGGKPGFFARLFGHGKVTAGPVYLVQLRAGAAGQVEALVTTTSGMAVPKTVAEPMLKQLYAQLK